MPKDTLKTTLDIIENQHKFICPPRFAKCTSFRCGGKCLPRLSPRFPKWCIEVKCTKCRKSWNVCKFCAPSGMQTSRLTTTKGIVEHNTLHCRIENVVCPIENIVCEKGTLKRKADAIMEEEDTASSKIVKLDVAELTELSELLNNPVQSMFIKHE